VSHKNGASFIFLLSLTNVYSTQLEYTMYNNTIMSKQMIELKYCSSKLTDCANSCKWICY